MVITKADLVKELMQRCPELSRLDAVQFIDAFFSEIMAGVKEHGIVKLPGLGNFVVRDKKARPGRNPKTGEAVAISARRVVTFHPSNKLREKITETTKQSKS